MAAYAFSWLQFPFRDSIFLIVVALLMVPVQVAFIPLLTLFKPFGLTKGFGAIWLAHTAFALPFGIFLLRNFFITLPRDLIEAARIDGAARSASSGRSSCRCPCRPSPPTGSSSSCGSGTTC